LTLTISLKTALPTGGVIICGAELTADSESETTFADTLWIEDVSSKATVSGSTATCTVNVPYSFAVPASSTTVKNTLSANYTVEMLNATGALPSLVVDLDGPFLNGSIPATGTITRVSESVTI
jgi:hypothetical protein